MIITKSRHACYSSLGIFSSVEIDESEALQNNIVMHLYYLFVLREIDDRVGELLL